MKRFSILMMAILIASVSFSQASTPANFSGTWAKQSTEEVEGPQYANALADKYVVTQTKDSLIIESYTGENSGGKQAFAINGGKTIVNSVASKRKYTWWLSWSADKKTVFLATAFSRENEPDNLDLTRVETWSLSEDGKTLNVKKKSQETQSETWATNGVYSKQ